MNTVKVMSGSKTQRGLGLIEVLITVLVLAIGLLGLASLQQASIRNNQSAIERSMGVVQSYSIIEAIRADPDSAKSGRFNVAINATPIGSTFPANTLTMWRSQLTQNLGAAATGSVDCDATSCTVIVQWDDSRGLAGNNTQQIMTEVHL
ncbi:type IV pilus modification protein PilV [Marinobacter psychrophilus]|uniref:type IV pilus modification protein PilV n=1 Tax=Marinobacter psychrophilus TaxID=330734 RepID=UPI001B49A70E|nr:type IV pilus modification protein PilV [Marinobacter psychrophilus]MBQ0761612.1 type IV pilus modification protein PilV [Marinobacter psychrophilus]MBQ0844146.1 type IV pilus modification protein PilV [Marinobacter psychrophilus]